ncbi:MAG: hypothetical protein E6Q73_14560 [Pseudorhodobacter sp.]|nr:MAG: hypothetical protein E6Q73_14560 [Pseudorhodobacter sp.]
MILDYISFYLERDSDPVGLHPFSHYLFGEQARAFCIWLAYRNDIKIDLPKPVSLRIEIVEPDREPSVRRSEKCYIVECPVIPTRYTHLPFEMVEGRMSKLFRAKGLTTEAKMRPLFSAPEANALFLDILDKSLNTCRKVFNTNTSQIHVNFQRFADNGYVASWIKVRKRFAEFGATAELEYILDGYSLRKEIVVRRKGDEIDRCLVTENGPDELQWGGGFDMKIEGREVVMAHGTFRYEPFKGVRMVSLSPSAQGKPD